MAITYTKLFQPTMLTTSDVTIFTAGSGVPPTAVLRGGRVRLTNVTTTPQTYRLTFVPSGGSASDTNISPKDKSLGPLDVIDIDLPTLVNGDAMLARAGAASSINIQFISGAYFTP